MVREGENAMTIINLRYLTIAPVLFVGVITHAVRAETLNCTPVTSLPAVITTQGIHCLTGNLATNITSNPAITITANNVTLDLNGWKVGGQAAGNGTNAVGIGSNANNVTIRNGIVRGFRIGIALLGRGAVVEDMLVDQNTEIGIYVAGQGAIVRRNQVVDTGGSTAEPDVEAIGIEADGNGSRVEHNLVSGLTATGSSDETGIEVDGTNSLAINNFVTDAAKPTSGADSSGFFVGPAATVNIVGNTVSTMIFCIDYDPSATGIYASNTVMGCGIGTNFFGGTAGQQGNNFIP
jgi:hypothetical protein